MSGEVEVGLGKKLAVEELGLRFLEVSLEALEGGKGVGAIVYVGVWCGQLFEERLETGEHPAWIC